MEQKHVELAIPPRRIFSKEQKFGYAVVIICGVFAVIFGFLYLGKHLKTPFQITYEGNHLLVGDEKEAREIEEQKKTDTDGDTISDYDELYIYETSPYLVDTDSDDVNDDVEIAANSDPSCAMGQNCVDELDEVGGSTEVASGLAEESATAAAEAAARFNEVKQLLAAMSTDEIRQMLIDSGADTAEVAAMSDEEVQELYSQVLGQLEATGGLDTLLEQAQVSAAEGAISSQ